MIWYFCFEPVFIHQFDGLYNSSIVADPNLYRLFFYLFVDPQSSPFDLGM